MLPVRRRLGRCVALVAACTNEASAPAEVTIDGRGVTIERVVVAITEA